MRRDGATVTTSRYRATCVIGDDTFRFPIRENVETIPLNTFVAEWRPLDSRYIDIEVDAPFGINWNVNTFDAFVHVTAEARKLATILGVAEGSLRSKQILVKLLRNVTKMGEQLRQLYVITGGGTPEADRPNPAAIQEELQAAVRSVLQKYGVIAEAVVAAPSPSTSMRISARTPMNPAVVATATTPSTFSTADVVYTTAAPAVTAATSSANSAVSAIASPITAHALSTPTIVATAETGPSILSSEYQAYLFRWISEARCEPYTGPLTLQYQASRDGWKGDDFRRMCNGQGSMVFVVRSSEGYLFGGYTSVGFTQYEGALSYDSNRHIAADDTSFVFTLVSSHNIAPSKFPCTRPEYALVNYRSRYPWGLHFYDGFGLISDCNQYIGKANVDIYR